MLLNQRLVLITPNAANVDNPITLEPLGGGRFRFVAPTGGGVVGEVVRFVEQTGRPMRMYTGDSWIDRVPRASACTEMLRLPRHAAGRYR